jgi:putative addiction module killer protein
LSSIGYISLHAGISYVNRGAEIVILLCGGDKRTQQQDIRRAHALAQE